MVRNFMIRSICAAMFSMLMLVGHAFAQNQTSGGITGKVTDPQGALVPNATVTATNTGTNSVSTAVTGADGGYRIVNLQPGTYTIQTAISGFSPAKAENVVVQVGALTAVDVRLSVGGQSAVVNVTAEAPVVNTSDNSNAQSVDQMQINDRPINGRRWSNFAILSPSAVPDGTFGLISFRGISGLLNNNTIDGGDNNQAFFSEERGRTRINYVISQAAIREFQINTSNYSAEYGRSAGGVTNAVTKSGTNDFHGEVFYYNRNNRNGARNPRQFQSVLVGGVSTPVPAKPIDLRQQWGGSIGGPIVKDKLFFFFNYDQQKRNFPGLSVFTSPTFLNLSSTQLSGTNGLLTAPAGTQAAPTGGSGLTLAQVGAAQAFLNSLTGETPRKGDQTLFFPKLDWQVNKSNSVSLSYNRLRWVSPNGIQTQAVNAYGHNSFGNDFVKVDSFNARVQSNISPTILNEFRFQYGRDFEYQYSTPPGPGEPPTSRTAVGGVRTPNVFITNGLQFGTPTFLERPKYPDERRVQFADSLTWIMGRHTFKFGGDFNHVSDDTVNLRFEAGAYSYNNLADFIIDYSNYLSANPATNARCSTSSRNPGKCYTSNFQQGIGAPGLKIATNDYNFFAQDDFRITPRLTVNLGLRYEYIQVPDASLPNSDTTVIPNDLRTIAEATTTLPKDKNNFGPRVGFAYDLFGDGRTSLRGGYGIYYGRIQSSTLYNAYVNTGNPAGQAQVAISATSTSPAAPIFPNVLAPSALTFRAGAIVFFDRNFQAPLINQYDVILEHQLFRDIVVSASYIGSLGRDLPTFVDQNYTRSTTNPTNTFAVVGGPFDGRTFQLPLYTRANPAYGALTRIESTVNSEYNGLVFEVKKRMSHGVQGSFSYTFAKATDTNQNSATFTQTNSPYDLFDRSYDNGPSNNDVRHKIVASMILAPEFYKGPKSSALNYVLNGWSLAPIFVFYSGRAFDGGVSGSSLNGSFGDNRFPLNSRNNFRLPNVMNMDARLSKRFHITEGFNLEALVEGFNIFNRTHVFGVSTTEYTRATTSCSNVNGTAGPVGFGANYLCYTPAFNREPTSTDSTLYRERQIQFSLRLQF